MRPKDAMREEWLETYEAQRNILWSQLIMINTYLFLVEKIDDFPFDLFSPFREQSSFWRATRNTLLESALMAIWRIAVDKDRRVLTLQKFTQNIETNLRNQKAKDFLQARLTELGFENRIASFEKSVKQVRHNFLAHLNQQMQMNPKKPEIHSNSLSLQDLKQLLDILRELFDVLCFTEYHFLWLWAYREQNRERGNTDVDTLLDSVAKNSQILNLPETNKDSWLRRREKLSPHELDIINAYRRKFQLPTV